MSHAVRRAARRRTRARFAKCLAILGTAGLLAACGSGGPAYGPATAGVAATVKMTSGLSFVPEVVTVEVGDTVEWRNTSLFTHTVTADAALADDPANVELPPGARAIHSGKVPAGEVFSYTFETAGTYRYVCLPHEGTGMRGTVVVKTGY